MAGFSFIRNQGAHRVKYTKCPLTFEQQADLLLSRNLVADKEILIARLRAVNYYRLSAYWHPFKQADNSFIPGTSLLPDPRHAPDWHTPVSVNNGRIFAVLTLLHCLLRCMAPQSHWRDRLFALFDGYREIPLDPMGIPANWKENPLWME